jgi:ubiquinone/menaquinone biosynthesis C-methylase UbiE
MSHLLPRSDVREFQDKGYWDSFFTKRSSAFEWYGEYADLCHILHKYLKVSSRILMAGCGNSKLSEDLYDAGFKSIDNIDISSVVIRQKKSSNAGRRGAMSFTKMDILDLQFEDEIFDCVVDKGTLDAIFSSTDDITIKKVHTMFSEIKRVLKYGGRYICITLAQDHILEKLLDNFSSSWLLRVHRVKLDVNSAMVGGALPVFVFVCTRMMEKEGMPVMKV